VWSDTLPLQSNAIGVGQQAQLFSPMNIVYLTKRWRHHTLSGGYDRLAQETDATVVAREQRGGLLHRIRRRLWYLRSRRHRYLVDYWYEDLLAEQRLLSDAQIKKPDVVHVLYGDEQLDFLLRARQLLPCPLVASFHLPSRQVANRFEFYQKDLLTRLDAAVVVSRCQLPDFQRWLGPDKVVYVPHGIDTRRFCPGDRSESRDLVRLVMVGDNMRDWKAWRRIIDQCDTERLPVQIDVVVKRCRWQLFARCKNIRLHANLPEDELIRLYQQADALLVPVVDATANNSVLESLACGTPTISNSVGGIPDYVDDTCGWLFQKGDVSGPIKLIRELCDNPDIAWSRREPARRKSLRFSWERIVKRLTRVYEALVVGAQPAAALVSWEQAPSHEELLVGE
jgi:glycosyltransferase involved in cell wall biosynthesis